MSTCIAPQCVTDAAAKGYCNRHYNRWRRHGDPLAVRPMCPRGSSVAHRLALVTDRTGGPDSCWPFTRAITGSGYGYLKIRNVTKGVHVWAFEQAHGAIPDGLVVRHDCDNPPCANPAHLRSGTPIQNMADKVARGRQYRARGESNPSARLTEGQVREIHSRRAAGTTTAALAADYSVSRALIEFIVTGKRWAHIKAELVAA